MWKGLIRLWLVATVISVPVAAEIQFNQTQKFWDDLTAIQSKFCVDAESNQDGHPDALKCLQQMGAYKTVFEHEEISPARYWSSNLAVYLVIDLVITALLLLTYLVGRWVYRGFKTV